MTGDLWAPASEDIRGKLLESVRGRLYLSVLDLQVGCGRRQELQRGHEGGGVGLHLAGHGDLTGSHGQPRVGVRGALRGRGALAVYRQVSSGARFLLDVRPMRTSRRGPHLHTARRTAPRARTVKSAAPPGASTAAVRPRARDSAWRERPYEPSGRTVPVKRCPSSGPAEPRTPPLPAVPLLPTSRSRAVRGTLRPALPRSAKGAWPRGGVIDAPHALKENFLEQPTPAALATRQASPPNCCPLPALRPSGSSVPWGVWFRVPLFSSFQPHPETLGIFGLEVTAIPSEPQVELPPPFLLLNKRPIR